MGTNNKRYKISVFILILLFTGTFVLFLKINPPVRPNIILITVDALRADHLSCYGYGRNTSPNIDRLAKEGAVFLNSFATSSNTFRCFPGLFTGRYLTVGVDYLFLDNILDKKFSTLAEYLKNSGYYTAAFINNNISFKVGKGFEQGFDRYGIEGDAEKMTTSMLNFLNDYRYNKPLFIWAYYLGPHAPYSPPEDYFRNFENDKLYKENDRVLQLKPESNSRFLASQGYIPRAVFHKDKFSLNYYIACYDAEILHTDFYIGRLLRKIKDNAIIILTADHGESLGEHNVYFSHGENIYDEVLHTPLIIKDNSNFEGGKRISAVVSSLDVVPTVLSRISPLRYFFNKNKFNGVDLKDIIMGKDIKRKYIYSYGPLSSSIRDVNKNVKYILNMLEREELYFLPDEYDNHIDDDSSQTLNIREKLKGNLKNWLKAYPIRADVNSKKTILDEQAKKVMKNLGYLQ